MASYPPKLQKGDTVRVISPARSISLPFIAAIRNDAQRRLESLGLKVTYGKHVEKMDEFNSSSIEHRLEDLHDAFADPSVKLVLTVIGGFNSNQLLKYIDYNLIKQNPKILCGFSDITALAHAIYAKTGMTTYSGVHFFNFGELQNFEYTIDYFQKCLFQDEPYEIKPCEKWSADAWAGSKESQENRTFIENDGYWIINEGKASGRLVGANLCTFQLLHGTEFYPGIKDSVLFIEDDDLTREFTGVEFDRDLQSLLHQPDAASIKGMVIGRFRPTSKITRDNLTKIIKTKKELDGVPVIANVDFGHTTPIITFPIGGEVEIEGKGGETTLRIVKH